MISMKVTTFQKFDTYFLYFNGFMHTCSVLSIVTFFVNLNDFSAGSGVLMYFRNERTAL